MTYEQLGYTEKHAKSAASVTSGLKSPTKIWKCPAQIEIQSKIGSCENCLGMSWSPPTENGSVV